MKKLINYLLLLLICCGCSDDVIDVFEMPQETSNVPQHDYYYYSNGQKHYLELNTDYVFISSPESQTLKTFELLRNSRISKSESTQLEGIMTRTLSDKKFCWAEMKLQKPTDVVEYRENMEQLQQMNKDVVVAPYFRNSLSNKIGLSNYFYVKVRELKDSVMLKEMATKTKVKLVGSNSYMPHWYILSITPESEKNALEMANLYYETQKFEYAEPDFMEDALIDVVPDDPFLNNQWGIINYNLYSAWEITRGGDVNIAIVDQGISKKHQDLGVAYSYDSESDSSPSRLLGEHGTMCAGVAAADFNNNKGIAGVAPKAHLFDISNSLISSPTSQMRRANAIMRAWQAGADIISNSWHSGTEYTAINEAVKDAVTKGRNGKGCVVIFASGNDYRSSVSYPSSLPDVISVGAINNDNLRASFSNYGVGLELVAPGEHIYTTTYDGGYAYANGTSFACPYVAGVAALVISASPELTGEEVRMILGETCTKLSSYTFSNLTGHDNGTWNEEIGYGMVNAYEAVRKARELKPITALLEFCIANNDDYPNWIDCFLYDESRTIVWQYNNKLAPSEIIGGEINLSPGIYTIEADTYNAFSTYTHVFEIIKEGTVVIDFMGGPWDSCSGYSENVDY